MPPAKRRGNVAKTSGAMKYVQEPRKPNKRGPLSLPIKRGGALASIAFFEQLTC